MTERQGYLDGEYVITITKGSPLETRTLSPSHGPRLGLAGGRLRIQFDTLDTFRRFVADLSGTLATIDASQLATPRPGTEVVRKVAVL
jgi:hypothetical protein